MHTIIELEVLMVFFLFLTVFWNVPENFTERDGFILILECIFFWESHLGLGPVILALFEHRTLKETKKGNAKWRIWPSRSVSFWHSAWKHVSCKKNTSDELMFVYSIMTTSRSVWIHLQLKTSCNQTQTKQYSNSQPRTGSSLNLYGSMASPFSGCAIISPRSWWAAKGY